MLLLQLLDFQRDTASWHFQDASCILALSFKSCVSDEARKPWNWDTFGRRTTGWIPL